MSIIENMTAWERILLLAFWATRDKVTDEDRCPTPLACLDSGPQRVRSALHLKRTQRTQRCVLSRRHLDGEQLQANVPHACADGRLAPLLVSWETIREAQYWEGVTLP